MSGTAPNRTPEETMLHLLMGQAEHAWTGCAASCQPGDTVVVMDEGVVTLAAGRGLAVADFPCDVVVLDADEQARVGRVLRDCGAIDHVDDEALVRLIETHSHCLSWR